MFASCQAGFCCEYIGFPKGIGKCKSRSARATTCNDMYLHEVAD